MHGARSSASSTGENARHAGRRSWPVGRSGQAYREFAYSAENWVVDRESAVRGWGEDLDVVRAREQFLEHDRDLVASEARAQAEVRSAATEGDVIVWCPRDVEAKRILEDFLVSVRGRVPQGDALAFGDRDAADLGRSARPTRRSTRPAMSSGGSLRPQASSRRDRSAGGRAGQSGRRARRARRRSRYGSFHCPRSSKGKRTCRVRSRPACCAHRRRSRSRRSQEVSRRRLVVRRVCAARVLVRIRTSGPGLPKTRQVTRRGRYCCRPAVL